LQTSVALRLIGKTTDDYIGVIFKLERQLRTHEERLQQLGIVTRDVHGEYLKGPEIFRNALAAMQEYRAGTDQNLFALEAFGKGAKDVYDFIKLNDATMERAAQLIRELNIELQDPAAVRAYKIEIAALGLAWEKVEEQITSALLGPLTALARYFNSEGPGAIRIFIAEFQGLAAAAITLNGIWQSIKVGAAEAWDSIIEIMRSAQEKARAILTLSWGELERLSKQHELRMTAIAQDAELARLQIYQRGQAAIRQVFGMPAEEGGGETPITLPDVTVRAGTKRYTLPDSGGGGRAGKAPKAEKDDTEARELERLRNEERIDDLIRDRRTKLIEANYRAGKISLDQEQAALVAQLEEKRAAETDYLAKKLAAAQGDAKEQQKLQEQDLVAYQNYLTKKQDLDIKYNEAKVAADKKAAADASAALDKALQPLTSSFDSAIKGYIQGTSSLRQAVNRAFEGVLIDPLIKNVENGLKAALENAFSGEFTNSLLGKFFAGTLFSGAGSAAGEAAGASGGGGLFGWLGALLAFGQGGIVPSAAGGWAVPPLSSGGILARLHSNEMVLPANISQGLQDVIGGGAGAGTTTHNWHVSAVDAAGVAKFFKSNAPALVAAVNHGTRNGSALRTS
jgi:hypothetical protein